MRNCHCGATQSLARLPAEYGLCTTKIIKRSLGTKIAKAVTQIEVAGYADVGLSRPQLGMALC